MSKIKKEIIKKDLIDKIWKLSRESFQNDVAFSELKTLEKEIIPKISTLIIIYVDNYNQANELREYYSFYRIFSLKGKYLFSLPARLDLPVSEWEKITDIITRVANNPSKSNNGGDYYSGYRIWKLTHPNIPNEIYKVAYSRMLYSDFQEQGWEKPELCYSIQEIAKITGETIDIKNSI